MPSERASLYAFLTPMRLGGSRPVVICGFGQLGQAVTQALIRKRRLEICAIDKRDTTATRAREQGLRSICGNAEDTHTLRIAGVGSATDIVICIEGAQNEKVLRVARSLAPTAFIQMVLSTCPDPEKLRELGANRVLVISGIAGKALADWAMTL